MITTDLANNPQATFVFAHGAGAGSSHHFMVEMTAQLVKKNINVVRFHFDYMKKMIALGKRRPPDKMPTLISCYQQTLTEIQEDERLQGIPLFIGGKSMGSRVAIMMAQDDLLPEYPMKIHGVIALGYPFHPIGKPEKDRLLPLQQLSLPSLIIQGSRDKLGNSDEINGYNLPVQCQVRILLDGDHDFKTLRRSSAQQNDHIATASHYIKEFIDEQIDCL